MKKKPSGRKRQSKKPNRWRLSGYVAVSLVAFIITVAVVILLFGGTILNGYGKSSVERAFAKAHPGSALQLGHLHYSMGANRLMAQSLTVTAPDSTLTAGRIAVTGVRWVNLLRGKAALANILAQASLEASNLNLEFTAAHYGIACSRLRASVPDSELVAEGAELRTLVSDEELFAKKIYRTTRFKVTIPACTVAGLAYGDLFQGKACRARSLHLSQPKFDALVNRDKPVAPLSNPPLMVHEALAAIPQMLQLDHLTITNGLILYGERVVAGAAPGVLTFGDVNISVAGLSNRREAAPAIELSAQCKFMNASVLKLKMEIPVASPDFSYHYSGSLGSMDLPRLNAFLDIAERTRIKRGIAQEAIFDITVTNGTAHGRLQAGYADLEVAILDQQTDTETGIKNRLASLLMNKLKIRDANPPNPAGVMKGGSVDYTRKPDDEFLQFTWYALRSGVLDLITR